VSGIGLAGFGTVGSGVWKILERNGGLITSRSRGNVSLEIRKICVRDLSKPRDVDAPAEIFTTDLMEVVNDPAVDIVVELIGGTDAAFDLVAAALKAQKPVVTGNVAGGIPIIKAVQESLVGNRVEAIVGIINGTSNYILQRMTEAGLGYPEALKEAKDLGYAEADETLDVNGWDAAHKAILLGSLAHGFLIDPKNVYVRGIERITPLDIHFASKLGYVVKLISMGRGAGQEPTASSAVSDLVDAGLALRTPDSHRAFIPHLESGKVVAIDDTESAYYVRFPVKDQAGVLAEVSRILTEHGISLSGAHSELDPENPDADFDQIVFLIHTCPFGQLKKALAEVETLEHLTDRPVVFRIESL